MLKDLAERLLSVVLTTADKKRWIAVPVLLLIFISPFLLLTALSYIHLKQDLTRSVLSRRETVVYLAAATMKEKFDRMIDIGLSLATRVRFRQWVDEGKWHEAIRLLNDVPDHFPFIDRLFLADIEGTLTADWPESPGVRGQNFAGRDWYQGVRREWKPYVSEAYRRAADPQYNVVAVAVPIRSEDKRPVGILVLQVRVETLLQWAKDIEVGPSGFVYFVDQKGHLTAHPRFSTQGPVVDFSAVPSVQKALRGRRGVEILFNPVEKEERISAYAPIPEYGWGVVAQQPTRTAFSERDATLRMMLAFCGGVSLFSGALGYLILHALIKRRKTEEEHREQTAFLKSIMESLGEGVVVADRNGRFVLWNPAAERIIHLGPMSVSPEEWSARYGIYLPDQVTPYPAERLPLARAIRGESIDGDELFVRHAKAPQGVWLSVSGRPLIDGSGALCGGVVVLSDITERKQAEEEKRKSSARLEAANKELEAFSYSVSHDLRAPLRSIDGFSQALLEDFSDRLDDQARDHLKRVRAASQRMAQLIDDMLNLSRVTRAEMRHEQVDLSDLARGVAEELKKSEPERQAEFFIQQGLAAEGDARLLRVAVVNLLENAWKFSGKQSPARIDFGAVTENGRAVYYVRDNGAGFDMAYAGKLFGAFQRLHTPAEFPGTGIGLATVQRIVHRHGGRVWAEGEVGKGATFYFTLDQNSV